MTDLTTLTRALVDIDRDVRFRAAMAFGEPPAAPVASALIERLGAEDDCNIRETITWACVQQQDVLLPQLIDALTSPDAGVRRQASHVLSKIGGADLAQHLHGVVADPDPEVAVKAFRAAANTGNPEVVPSLARRLGDGDQEQKDALTTAFAKLAGHGVEALIAALSDPDAEVRAHAADTLGHLGSPDADPALSALSTLLIDPDADVRLAAVGALGELDSELSAAALQQAVDSPDQRVSAVAKRLI